MGNYYIVLNNASYAKTANNSILVIKAFTRRNAVHQAKTMFGSDVTDVRTLAEV